MAHDSAPRRRRPTRITDRDRELLAFVAEHRLVLVGHVAALLQVSAAAAYARLSALCSQGSLRKERIFDREPGHYQITRAGLAVIESTLPTPRVDLRSYRHDVGVAWLWLIARSGTFGELRDVVSERQMRSHDGAREREHPLRAEEPFGVRLGGYGPGGRERLHYPDLLLVDRGGNRIALELELTSKSRRRREQILMGYAADPRVEVVVYLVADPAVGRKIHESARRLDVSDRVKVQRVRWGASGGVPEAGATRQRSRSATAGRSQGQSPPEAAR